MAFDLRHFFQRTFFHVGTVAFRIVKQVNQLAALFKVKSYLSCLAQ
ncbi:Uncharacterised protein [Enterobacter cloacae]|nr:Uncharacterised protein [Enterobacter cloacae]